MFSTLETVSKLINNSSPKDFPVGRRGPCLQVQPITIWLYYMSPPFQHQLMITHNNHTIYRCHQTILPNAYVSALPSQRQGKKEQAQILLQKRKTGYVSHTASKDELTLNSLTIALPTHGYLLRLDTTALKKTEVVQLQRLIPILILIPVGELPREVTPITTQM